MGSLTGFRRIGAGLAAAAFLATGGALIGAPAASAAAVDYDCDYAPYPGEVPGSLIGDGCTPQSGNPDEPVHLIAVYYGLHYLCDRAEERPDGTIIAYGCREAPEESRR